MSVDSALSMFTLLFGWQFYGIIWDGLVSTGLAYLPFLGVLFRTFVETRTEGDLTDSRPRVAVTRLETEIFLMFLVLILAVIPYGRTSLSAGTLSHTPLPSIFEDAPATVTPASPGSTFGTADGGFGDYTASVETPALWFAVVAVSQGLNRGILASFPDVGSIRELQQVANLANISDPAIKAETNAFFTYCYVEARGDFLAEQPAGVAAEDVWMGSEAFQDLYYDDIRSEVPITGFPYDASRDFEWAPGFEPEWGKPTCNEWWNGDNSIDSDAYSLRKKLLGQVEFTASDNLIEKLVAEFDTLAPASVQDWAIRKVLSNSPPNFSDETLFNTRQSNLFEAPGTVIKNDFSAAGANVGVPFANLFFTMTTDVLVLGAPMIQALILMGMIAILPIGLVVSRYSMSFVVAGAFALFTVQFWTVLWYMISWIDDQLILALWPERSYLLDGFFSIASGDVNGFTKKLILNMIIMTMYFFLPTIFTVIMGIAGARAASGVGTIAGRISSGGLQQAGTSSAGAARSATSVAGSAGRSALRR